MHIIEGAHGAEDESQGERGSFPLSIQGLNAQEIADMTEAEEFIEMVGGLIPEIHSKRDIEPEIRIYLEDAHKKFTNMYNSTSDHKLKDALDSLRRLLDM